MIKISYDEEGDILEIKFSESSISSSEYIEESGLVIDYRNQERATNHKHKNFDKSRNISDNLPE